MKVGEDATTGLLNIYFLDNFLFEFFHINYYSYLLVNKNNNLYGKIQIKNYSYELNLGHIILKYLIHNLLTHNSLLYKNMGFYPVKKVDNLFLDNFLTLIPYINLGLKLKNYFYAAAHYNLFMVVLFFVFFFSRKTLLLYQLSNHYYYNNLLNKSFVKNYHNNFLFYNNGSNVIDYNIFNKISMRTYGGISLLNSFDDAFVSEFLNKHNVGSTYLSRGYLYGFNYDQAVFFSFSDGLNAFNAFNYYLMRKSFNFDKYSNISQEKKYPNLLKHREALYEFDGSLIVHLILELGQHWYAEVINDRRLNEFYEDFYEQIYENFFRIQMSYYNVSNLFVLNTTYDLMYTLFVVQEFKYYGSYRYNFYLSEIFSLTDYLKLVLGIDNMKNVQRPFKKFVKNDSNYFYNFGLNADFGYNNVLNIGVYRNFDSLLKNGQYSNLYISDFLTLVFNYKYLTYNYLLNFSLSVTQGYSYFAHSMQGKSIVYPLSNSIHSLIPQNLVSSSRLNAGMLMFNNIGNGVVTDPMQYLNIISSNEQFSATQNSLLSKDGLKLILHGDVGKLELGIDDNVLRSIFSNNIKGGHKRKNRWRSNIYSKYFRLPSKFFFFEKKKRFFDVYGSDDYKLKFYFMNMPWILYLILFFILLLKMLNFLKVIFCLKITEFRIFHLGLSVVVLISG